MTDDRPLGGMMERLRKAIDACSDWNEPSADGEKRLVAELAAVEARIGRLVRYVRACEAPWNAETADELVAARAAITADDLRP